MNKNNPVERLINGIVKENPTLVLMLGMCPTLAVTTSAINGAGMGLTTTAVLMFSNMIISLLRNFIPDRVRIPAYIVIIASLVTIVQFVLQAYLPELNESLGYAPICESKWPEYDEAKTIDSEIELPIQINGRVKGTVKVALDSDEETVKNAAHKEIAELLEGKNIVKEIYVKNKIFNIVVK